MEMWILHLELLTSKWQNYLIGVEQTSFLLTQRNVILWFSNLDKKTHKYDLAFSKDGYPIEHVKETVFLGVVVDENLTWKPHILNVKVHWYPVQVKFLPVYSLSCLSSYFVV